MIPSVQQGLKSREVADIPLPFWRRSAAEGMAGGYEQTGEPEEAAVHCCSVWWAVVAARWLALGEEPLAFFCACKVKAFLLGRSFHSHQLHLRERTLRAVPAHASGKHRQQSLIIKHSHLVTTEMERRLLCLGNARSDGEDVVKLLSDL